MYVHLPDVEIDVPDSLDLTHLKSPGILPGEELLPADDGGQEEKGME